MGRGRENARRPQNRIRVLESVHPPGPMVQYVDQVVVHAPEDVCFSFFSYRTALFGDYDVVHVHWPEWLVRHRSRLGTTIKRILFRLLLLRVRVRRVPVVRTVHNLEPHESLHESERRLFAELDRLTNVYVVLSDCTPISWPGQTVIIPHGDYREAFEAFPRKQKVPGRVLLFGKIRPYKGVLELIRAAEDIESPRIQIRIVGRPTEAMRAKIEGELAKPDRRGAAVSVELRMIPDDELVEEISMAELIVLPYRNADNSNSGAAMLALSLDRPILAPSSCLMNQLAKEAGAEWVYQMDSDVTANEIVAAVESASALPDSASPRLVDREWETIATSYADVFRDAHAKARQRVRPTSRHTDRPTSKKP